jgi:MFS transporter, DHA1 family, multidrug resistance protein
MLEQQQHESGSASSMINFFGMVMGSAGMLFGSQEGNNMIVTLGIIQLLIGLIGGGLWLLLRSRSFIKQSASKPSLQEKPV